MDYYVKAKVTGATDTELELTGNWPNAWLQFPLGSMDIYRKMYPGEPFGAPDYGSVQFGPRPYAGRSKWPNLQLGDDVIVKCSV